MTPNLKMQEEIYQKFCFRNSSLPNGEQSNLDLTSNFRWRHVKNCITVSEILARRIKNDLISKFRKRLVKNCILVLENLACGIENDLTSKLKAETYQRFYLRFRSSNLRNGKQLNLKLTSKFRNRLIKNSISVPEVLAYRMVNYLTSKFRRRLIKNSICFKGSSLQDGKQLNLKILEILSNIYKEIYQNLSQKFQNFIPKSDMFSL